MLKDTHIHHNRWVMYLRWWNEWTKPLWIRINCLILKRNDLSFNLPMFCSSIKSTFVVYRIRERWYSIPSIISIDIPHLFFSNPYVTYTQVFLHLTQQSLLSCYRITRFHNMAGRLLQSWWITKVTIHNQKHVLSVGIYGSMTSLVVLMFHSPANELHDSSA